MSGEISRDRAFELLYARYRRRITSYIHGRVGDRGRAEDITQEVFISALRRMRDTDRPIAFRPWIYEIAKNGAIDHVRARNRRGRGCTRGRVPAGGAVDPGGPAPGRGAVCQPRQEPRGARDLRPRPGHGVRTGARRRAAAPEGMPPGRSSRFRPIQSAAPVATRTSALGG